MSSIADKFKKLLPVSNGNDKARVDGSGSISLDDVDTVQVPDEKTVRLARKSSGSAAAGPDTTFGEDVRVSSATLDEEGSGYFLVPKGPLPEGWRSVSAQEGAGIWGRGEIGRAHV